MQNEVSDRCERSGSGPDAAAILAECHIAQVVKPVLDGFKQAFGTRLDTCVSVLILPPVSRECSMQTTWAVSGQSR